MNDAIEHALHACLSGNVDQQANATLTSFREYNDPELDADRAAACAARNFDELVERTRSDDERVRHLAVYCLGFSRSPRAVHPIITAEAGPGGDFFDHDFVYVACKRLGTIALEELYRIASEGDDAHRFVAVQALGQSEADAWPYLHRLFVAGNAPRSFFSAYENLRDPRGLADVWVGLQSSDEQTLADAVGAAHSLLEEVGRRKLTVDIDRTAWARRFVELLESEHDEIVGFPIACLGYLADPATLPLIADLAKQGDDDAIEAVACYGNDEARDVLISITETGELEPAAHAAARLLRNDFAVPTEHQLRLVGVMKRALLELEHDSAWCQTADTLPTLPEGKQAMREVLAGDSEGDRDHMIEAIRYHFRFESSHPALPEFLASCEPEIAERIREALD